MLNKSTDIMLIITNINNKKIAGILPCYLIRQNIIFAVHTRLKQTIPLFINLAG